MGCDIHCYLEYKLKGNDRWRSFGGSINPGRSYVAFAVLAGVRNWFSDVPGNELPVPFPRRGMPSDAGYDANDDNWLFVDDSPDYDSDSDHITSRATAERWVKNGSSKYKGDDERGRKLVSHPDWHSHSWLTPAEMRHALESLDGVVGYKFLEHEYHRGWQVMLAVAEKLAEFGAVRIVFWFDN